jgi:hypothetical protein
VTASFRLVKGWRGQSGGRLQGGLRQGQLGVGDDKNRGDKSTPFVPVDLGL